jgi:hypothetical protein
MRRSGIVHGRCVRGAALAAGALVLVAAACAGSRIAGVPGAPASVEPDPACAPATPDLLAAPPWEVWRDLRLLARPIPGDRLLMRSSHCEGSCRPDYHSAEDPRVLRMEGDEAVIFEDLGAGAITRIWVTMGEGGISSDIDPDLGIRIRLDGRSEPAVDLPLAGLFDGTNPPFVPPLVSDRQASSGGHVCTVPIPYRSGCRVSLVGAAGRKLWYQVSARRAVDAASVTSFGEEGAADGWARLLAERDPDPWRGRVSPVSSGKLRLEPGGRSRLVDLAGPDVVNGVLLRAPRWSWPDLDLELRFDGDLRVDVPVSEFFAVGRGGRGLTRSLLLGAYDGGELYCYFPMPFFERASVELVRRRSGGRHEPVAVEWAVRRSGCPPLPGSARFGARLREDERTPTGRDVTLLELRGRGRWVGLFAEVGGLAAGNREYLEGDERVFVDREGSPSLYGTGVEDFFGGGFYFRVANESPVPFRLPLHGMVYDRRDGRGYLATAMYRLMLTDAVPFARHLRVGLEGGTTHNVPMRLRTVAYYYLEK